jgi:hypothetical protein
VGGRAGTRRACRSAAALFSGLLLAAAVAPGARAELAPQEALTYLPFGFVYSERPPALVVETLEQLQSYGIGQALLPLPPLKKSGVLKLNKHERRMLALWSSQTSAFDAGHGASIAVVASLSGKVSGRSLNLESPAVRANVLAGVETALGLGAGGISLDLEPYPSSHGFVLLLGEIDELLAERGLGRVAVTAPATVGRWSPAYLGEVSAELGEVDPLFYDSERTMASAYRQWVSEGLAYYSAYAAPGARIVPDLPSYGANPWHDPAVENLATATDALEAALLQGDRVNGAGIFWWWGFYYDEEGEGSYNGAADRETWLTRTRSLAFAP